MSRQISITQQQTILGTTCPQCQAYGNLTIFVCSSAHCNSKYCEHCKEQEYPRLCASCIHIQRRNEYAKQQEFNRTLINAMKAKENEKKRRIDEVVSEMQTRLKYIEKEAEINEQHNIKNAYLERTRDQSFGIFFLISIILYVVYGLTITDTFWDAVGLVGVILFTSGIVYVTLTSALLPFDKNTSLHRNLYKTSALLSPIFGFLISVNLTLNLGAVGCFMGILGGLWLWAVFGG